MMRLLISLFLFLTTSCIVLWGAALAFEAAQATRVNYKYIASALTPLPQSDVGVTWNPPETDLIRPFTDADAVLIGRAFQEAWQVHAVAQDSGNIDLLADRFTGVAEERAALSVEDAQAHGGRMVVLSQNASPLFYHKDGSLFQARVEMVTARYISPDGMGLSTIEITRDSGIATLLNESNGWRIMSWERRDAQPLGDVRAGFEGHLVGMNYYPAATPWRKFWPDFDPRDIARDFEKVADLNANSVRIFLTRSAFIGADADDALRNLEMLLSLAGEQGLQVVPTLFDLKQDFSLGTWADDATYLHRVLPVLAGSPAVAFVDLKNEPDLDFAAHGTAKIKAWLQSMLLLSRDAAPGLAFTIGWSTADAAAELADELDVITYHDYAALSGTADRLSDLRTVIKDKPIFVTEIGDSTFNLAAGFPGSEQAQAERLAARLQMLSDADGVMIWTLYDFADIDPTVVGRSPWVKRLQSSFGVLRTDGSQKPAAEAVRAAFSASH